MTIGIQKRFYDKYNLNNFKNISELNYCLILLSHQISKYIDNYMNEYFTKYDINLKKIE